ncbi:tripartite motif-containing protein 16-like [Ctenopharyngodon idella]|uniref:tripartite motif-containing protein 16-like n=1 Tax=Ctenopharyngodon idella TaxID=7959 RepID=UPI00222E18D5|nr:tripartite motif-containing protein 16-like [Ctenopharyngodon idella]
MAGASISVDQNRLTCPVCLDLLNDPVTIPCGHSYCMSCITNSWNQREIYRCPLCNHTFNPRPVLHKNVVFAELVEELKKTSLQAATPAADPPAVDPTGSEDVPCDSCTGNKQKAVKSCLECQSSYCQNHLQQHESLFGGKGHNLMDATEQLREMICPKHGKMLEIYCRTDQQCVCMLCLVDEHKNHDTVSTAEARTEKQRHFEETLIETQMIIQQRQKELREAVESHKRSAQTAVEDSERTFTELISSIERRRSEVTQLIRDQERFAVSRAEERLEGLEQKIDDLRRRDAEMKQLSQRRDHVHFLQGLPSLYHPVSTDGFGISSHLSFDNIVRSFSQLTDKLQQFSRETIENTNRIVESIHVIGAPEYQTREEFLQYSRLLTLDLNSVNSWLRPFEENTVIACSETSLPYPDHPDRFDYWCQAFCVESLTGRCYWEVEWAGNGTLGVVIGVAYKSISRKGDGPESVAGFNDQSWSLYCTPTFCSFCHNNIETVLPVVSRRIGVYVDHSAGILSFYSVSHTMSLIHRVQTTFTQPLYAVFGLDRQAAMKLCCLTN